MNTAHGNIGIGRTAEKGNSEPNVGALMCVSGEIKENKRRKQINIK